jgi:DNA topoisomerase III
MHSYGDRHTHDFFFFSRDRKIPAFRVFGDRALLGIATTCPHNDAELLAVPGIGMSIVKKYGAHIYRLVAGSS